MLEKAHLLRFFILGLGATGIKSVLTGIKTNPTRNKPFSTRNKTPVTGIKSFLTMKMQPTGEYDLQTWIDFEPPDINLN
ncbi:hypothetical protein J7E38_03900 [Bacillus sp. ISL-35]|uniref:hypothetical protein n=1 Tax=Bacillus sp. ISL-35 TaxID=2819122 RepID=UPI001BECF55E|nr:hypothetical protein [Bacillus sp. ISL-35]MBT2678129.1 hypothetical protein [Bacillus sp. ISL-35]MBT2702584.1 hypothetical protein [Chryseobacterium sp. ISL-80]